MRAKFSFKLYEMAVQFLKIKWEKIAENIEILRIQLMAIIFLNWGPEN